MSWFGLGGGGSKPNKDEKITELNSNSASPYNNFDADSSSSFASSNQTTTKFEEILQEEQKKLLVQAIMFKLTDISFEQCVKKPSTSLSAIEKSCITSVSSKYLESSQFIVAGLGPLLGNQQQER